MKGNKIDSSHAYGADNDGNRDTTQNKHNFLISYRIS